MALLPIIITDINCKVQSLHNTYLGLCSTVKEVTPILDYYSGKNVEEDCRMEG